MLTTAQFIGVSAAVFTSIMLWLAVVLSIQFATRPLVVFAIFATVMILEIVFVGHMPSAIVLASKITVYAIVAALVFSVARAIKKRTN